MEWNQWVVLTFLVLYHFFILNRIEKQTFSEYLPKPVIQRPSKKCKKQMKLQKYNYDSRCYGMPSGSTQAITILTFLLYQYKYLSLPLTIFLIIVVGLQRIFTKRHTLLQVLFGFIFGAFYAGIYSCLDLSYICLLIPLGFTAVFLGFTMIQSKLIFHQ